MPGTSMVDDFRLSQDPIMKRAWKERFEPNFETYKTLKVGYGKYQYITYHLINSILVSREKPYKPKFTYLEQNYYKPHKTKFT